MKFRSLMFGNNYIKTAYCTKNQEIFIPSQFTRVSFEHSPLAKPDVIANGLEGAFRLMWQAWCNGLPTTSFEVKSLLN